MKKYIISKEFGDVCVNGSNAKKYADEHIVPVLKTGEKVTIDFEGVEMASSSFLNSIVFNTYGYEIVPNQVTFKSDDDLIKHMLQKAIRKLESELN